MTSLSSVLLSSAVLSLALVSTSSAQNLLSRYVLDGTTSDSGSVGADGSLQGSAAYISNAPGNFSQSLDVTGSGANYMEANVGGAYSGLTELTITFWVNLQGPVVQNDRLVSNLEASTLDGFDIRMSSGSPSAFKLSYNVNTTNSPAVSGDFNANDSWAFLAVTYDSTLGSNQVSYYSGSETVSASLLNTATQTGSLKASSLLRIGSTPASTADRTPATYLSDVRVYSGVLDLSQLDTVRASVNAVPEPSAFALITGGVILTLTSVRRSRS